MESFELRLAQANDEPDVTACVHAAYTKYIERIGKKPGPMLDDYRALIADGHVYVVQKQKIVCGILVLRRKPDHLLLDNIAVHPGWQKQGLGRELMSFAERYALENGFREIRLYTNELMAENLQLYARLGYQETERRSDQGYQRVFMRKQLHPADTTRAQGTK